MPIPQTIIQARHALGLTQQQLADACGVTRRAVQNWEYGRRFVPVDKLRIVAKTLRLRLDDLVP